MNKKIVLACIIIITLVFICTMNFFYKDTKYDNLVIDEEMWNKIINTRSISDSNLITSIKFNDYEIVYDNANCTYYYSLIESLDNKYNPNVNYKTNKKDLKIAMSKQITDEVIENNTVINILVYNDIEFSIYNLKCTSLPLLNIVCSESPDNISKQEDTDMNLYLFDNSKSTKKRITRSDGKIHVRGAITALFEKKGYKISLTQESLGNNTRKNFVSLLGMRQDDDWILYAAYNDQEKVRNVFATNLWYESCSQNNIFNINNGNQYKYVELFLNNEYWGLYALGYPIDEKQLNIDSDTEYMFKKLQYDEAELNVVEQETIEMSNYELVNNTKDKEMAWNSLKNYYITLFKSKDINELYNISDINNLIDYYLFTEVIQANDNPREMYLKNVFLTIKNHNNKQVILYTPWDYDMSMGNIFSAGGYNYTLPYYVGIEQHIDFKLNAIGFLQELNDTKINELIKNRYSELRKTYWSEGYLEQIISEYSKQIYDSGAFKRDRDRWPDGSYNYENEKLTKFKSYVFERLKYTDRFVDEIK